MRAQADEWMEDGPPRSRKRTGKKISKSWKGLVVVSPPDEPLRLSARTTPSWRARLNSWRTSMCAPHIFPTPRWCFARPPPRGRRSLVGSRHGATFLSAP